MLLTKRQVAAQLGVTERCIDLWVSRGFIDRPIKLGPAQQSRVRFHANAVETVAERLARQARPQP